MTLLIAVGAVMIFVVWNQGKKRQQKVEERREVEETTGKLKQELEKTANEVISRMENQVSGLEDLLDDSEKNRTILEGRVAELKKLLKRSEGQSTEIRDLLTKLEEASDTVEELQRKLEAAEKRIAMSMQVPQMPVQSTMMPMSSLPPMTSTPPLMTPSMMSSMMNPPMMTSPLPNVPSPISPPPILSSRQNPTASIPVAPAAPAESKSSTETAKAVEQVKSKAVPEAPKPKKMDKAEMKAALEKVSAESSKAEPKDFAKVLEKSIEKSEVESKSDKKVITVPDRRSIIVSSRSSQRGATVVNSTEPVKIESRRTGTSAPETNRNTSSREAEKAPVNNTAKIKDMLLDGMSVEDIARETGLGRGAVELVQEMTRRKLERK